MPMIRRLMKKTKIQSVLAAMLLLVLPVFSVVNVFADEGGVSSTMTVSPMTQKLILVPGEQTRASIKVSNPYEAKQNLDYSVTVGSFSQRKDDDTKDDYGTVDTSTMSSYNQIVDWIILDRDSGSVAPNQTDVLSFTINVPEDAPAGGQYATILVQDDTDYTKDGGGNVSIKSVTRIGSIIYAEVAGETRQTADILENNVPSFLLSSKLETTSMVQNAGNVHTDAEYKLIVSPLFGGEEICTNEENPNHSLVLPETQKYYTQECDLPAVGIFRVKQSIKIFNEESVVEKIVIVCPLWLIFIIVFLIVLLVGWFITKGKKKKA